MTTILGIQAKKGKPGVVLLSDLAKNIIDETDLLYHAKLETLKIYINKKQDFAVGLSGTWDDITLNFMAEIMRWDIKLKNVINNGIFQKLKEINELRWNDTVPTKQYNELLIACRTKEPVLYRCFLLGGIEKMVLDAIGTGAKYAATHVIDKLSEEGILFPKYLSLDKAIDIDVEALEKASQDLYTSGLDIVVITPNEIYQFGKEIKEEIRKAKLHKITEIKEKIK